MTWTKEWPTTKGSYWFYGNLMKDGSWETIRLRMVTIIELYPDGFYRDDTWFFPTQNVDGVWLKVDEPPLPGFPSREWHEKNLPMDYEGEISVGGLYVDLGLLTTAQSPTNEELLRYAAQNPPPQEYFDETPQAPPEDKVCYSIPVVVRTQDNQDGGYSIFAYNSEEELLEDHPKRNRFDSVNKSFYKVELDQQQREEILGEEDPYYNGYISHERIEFTVENGVAKLTRPLGFSAGQ